MTKTPFRKLNAIMTPLSTQKRVLGTLSAILTVIIFAFVIYAVTCTVIAKVNNAPVRLFGYSYHTVVTPSMVPTIRVGETVAVKSATIEQVRQDEIIVYRCIDTEQPIYGQYVIHRVVAVGTDEQGTYLITKGDNNLSRDRLPTRADNFLGIAEEDTVIAGMVGFFSDITNWFFLAAVALLLWFSIRMFRRVLKMYRQEHRKEIETNNLKAIALELGIDIEREKEREKERVKLLAVAKELDVQVSDPTAITSEEVATADLGRSKISPSTLKTEEQEPLNPMVKK